MKQELIKEIELIPMLPESILKIEKVYADPESSIQDMSAALQSDPVMVANILKIANSPLYGFSREIKDISQAVSLYGKDTIRSFAINIAANVCVPVNVEPYNISVNGYVKKAQVQNALITSWLSKVDRNALSLLSPASFLVEIGKIIISQYLVKNDLAEAFRADVNQSHSFEKSELNLCGSRSYDVAATIFFNWNFNSDLVHLVRYADDPEDALDDETKNLAKYLKVAKSVVTFNGEITEESKKRAATLIEEYELNFDTFEEALGKVQAAA
jgi:HD-like signal output (HDOD) protein